MIQNYYVCRDLRPVQLELFGTPDEEFELPTGITYLPDFLPKHRSLYRLLSSTVRWKTRYATRETITWGESYHPTRRNRCRYPWPEFLVPLAKEIRNRIGYLPNNCVANHYPNGRNSIGFHSDRGMEMMNGTGVAIISLGAVRHMVLRRIDKPSVRYHFPLEPGSCFHMDDEFQSVWQHGLLPESGSGTRISLSFRRLFESVPENRTGC